jgi:folate-binding protein YgfZ
MEVRGMADLTLDDRGVARISGPDAATFLQGLLTNDVEKLAPGESRFAALLSPQGKILFDFLVFREGPEAFLIDAPADKTAELVKRLGFYKLRAKVTVSDESASLAVVVAESGEPTDPREARLGRRVIVARDAAPAPDAKARAAYEARRIALGVPQGGLDFAYADAFPADANMDLLNGVDFKKGCYVGQEVVSRMKHRLALRKRVVRLQVEGPAPAPGTPVLDGELPIGALGSAAGEAALALMRIDRLEEAEQAGRGLTVGGVRVTRAPADFAGDGNAGGGL